MWFLYLLLVYVICLVIIMIVSSFFSLSQIKNKYLRRTCLFIAAPIVFFVIFPLVVITAISDCAIALSDEIRSSFRDTW